MQLLQEFANTLEDSGLLQRLRDNLQELPRGLLQRFEAPQDYLLGSVTGEFNYHFTFKLEGGGFFQTGVLVASAARAPGGLPVPLRCRWKRRVGDLPVEIMGVTSNMYQISADDVGTEIIVEAQPADMEDGFLGVAVGEIGPFELDPGTRRSLDDALGAGTLRMQVGQAREVSGSLSAAGASGGGGRHELALKISADSVRVANSQGSGGREVAAEYSQEYPRVVIHPLDTVRFQLAVSEAKSFSLVAPSRTARDLIALTIRCFHARKHISATAILRQLLPVQPIAGAAGAPLPPGMPDARLDGCILLERLIKELNRTMQQKELTERVLRNTNNEKREMQDQLLETISGFTEVIEGLQDQVPDGSQPLVQPPVSAEQVQSQVRDTQVLQSEVQSCRDELQRLRSSREAQAESLQRNAAVAAQELRKLRDERGVLQARLAEVSDASASAQHQHKLEQSHTKELKRLRMDVETLHGQKEQLRRELQDKDREREELQQNFLYVKGQLDKVQMKQAQAAANAGKDPSKELRKHKETVDMVGEERSRLSMRLEAILNDMEKEKAYHEQSLERVMTANGRIMEEKDRAQREVKRLSKLYADSVKGFQADETMMTTASVYKSESAYNAGSGEGVDQEEVRAVRAQLLAKQEKLGKREQENEALKSRIRKLAVA